MMSVNHWGNFDIDIRSDDHAVELSNKLLLACNTENVHYICFHLNLETNFTLEGLKAIARSLRDGQHAKLLKLNVVWDERSRWSSESVVEMVKILYLEGNLQNLCRININNQRAQFLLDCFRIERNDQQMKGYFISSLDGSPVEFAACLHGNTQLRKLQIIIDASFTPDDVSALAAAMCNSQLTELFIYGHQSPPGTVLRGDILRVLCRDGIQASGRVWECLEIDAYYARVDDMSPVVDVIPFVKSLQFVHVGDEQQPKDEMHYLFKGLERSCHLVCLGLAECQLNVNDIRMLSRALRHHRSLKELDLSANNIGDASVAAFVEHWDEHSALESLELTQNVIGPKGAQQLINAVMKRPSMKGLHMCDHQLGNIGFQMVGEQLPHMRLKVLNLGLLVCDYSFGDPRKAYQSLLRGLKANHFLHKLDLPDRFHNDFGNELPCYIELSKHGRYLITNANAVAPTIWCTILAKCGKHPKFSSSMMFYFLREQPHLVRPMQTVARNVVADRTLTFWAGVVAKWTILAKCGRNYFSFCNSMMFYFLREQPRLVRPMRTVVQNVVPNRILAFWAVVVAMWTSKYSTSNQS